MFIGNGVAGIGGYLGKNLIISGSASCRHCYVGDRCAAADVPYYKKEERTLVILNGTAPYMPAGGVGFYHKEKAFMILLIRNKINVPIDRIGSSVIMYCIRLKPLSDLPGVHDERHGLLLKLTRNQITRYVS